MKDPNVNPDSNTPNPVPDTSVPLVITPPTPAVGEPIENGLGQLIHLVGNWASIPAGTYSWNVMPLPQDNVPDRFILKNFAYLEEMTFAEIPGTAPNRGGGFTQVANTLFYEQRVYFSPSTGGPSTGVPPIQPVPPAAEYMLVHAENGSWLFLDNNYQFPHAFPQDGSRPVPFPDGTTTLPNQDQSVNIVKQMSVPHGNSILAVGTVDPEARYTQNDPPIGSPNNPNKPTLATNPGAPSIPQVNTIPKDKDGNDYGAARYGAPNPVNGIETNSNINPNIKLVDYLTANPPTNYIHYKVTAPATDITNISFEQKHALVNGYDMDIWLLNPGTPQAALMYSQNIGMLMTLASNVEAGTIQVQFPHITCNVILPA